MQREHRVSDVKRSCECPHNGNGNGEGLLLAEQRPMVDRHLAAPSFKFHSAQPSEAHHLHRCQETPLR